MLLPIVLQRYVVPIVLGLSLTTASAQEKNKVVTAPEQLPPNTNTDFSDVPEGWLVGLERAKKQAIETKKDLLLNFAATDWIPPSIDLEEKVFTRKAFIEAASEHFILVRLDFPRKRHAQSEELQKANMQANADYFVAAYPAVILTDHLGRPYAQTGWLSGELTAESYLKEIMKLRENRLARDRSLEAAAAATGKEQASHLAEALKGIDPTLVLRFYEPEYRQVIALDPDNAAGMRDVVFYENKTNLKSTLDALAVDKKWEEILSTLDGFIADKAKTTEEKQQIEFYKIGALVQLQRLADLQSVLDQVIAMDPSSPIGKQANGMKPELAKLIKAQRAEEKKANPDAKTETKPASGKGQSPFKARTEPDQ